MNEGTRKWGSGWVGEKVNYWVNGSSMKSENGWIKKQGSEGLSVLIKWMRSVNGAPLSLQMEKAASSYEEWLRIHKLSSWEQLTRSGPQAERFGEGLTTPPKKNNGKVNKVKLSL